MNLRLTSALLLLALAGCTAPVAPPPPAPAAAPPAPPPPPAPSINWQDAPLSPGVWVYDGTTRSASFDEALTLQCVAGGIRIERVGTATAIAQMEFRTTGLARTLPAVSSAAGTAATLPATDPLLDHIVYSRGRWAVSVPGHAMLIVPSWAEVARLVEECRGR